MIYWRVGNIIIWNLVLEQRHFKGTKMAFKKSQCLFVPYLFSNIKCSWKHLNYNLRVLCIYDHDSFNMRSSCYIFSFFFFFYWKYTWEQWILSAGSKRPSWRLGRLWWAASTVQAPLWRNLLSCSGIAASWKGEPFITVLNESIL